MTPSVPGKAYFIAENHRHSTAPSGTLRCADGGNGTTFGCSDVRSTLPPFLRPRLPRPCPPARSDLPANAAAAPARPTCREPTGRCFDHYLSGRDRYNAAPNFIIAKTIGRPIRVN